MLKRMGPRSHKLLLFLFLSGCEALGPAPEPLPTQQLFAGDVSAPDVGARALDTRARTPDDAQADAALEVPDTTVAADAPTVDGTVAPDVPPDTAPPTGCPPDTVPGALGGCVAIDPVAGWVGSPCASDLDCAALDGGYCLVAGDGWPGGHCTKACDLYCPDQAGAPVTFCVEADTGGACVSRCDLSTYPTESGCRPGYACGLRERHTQPSSKQYVCLPEAFGEADECLHPTNPAGDESCYLTTVTYGDPAVETLALKILDGTATPADAEAFLDANYEASQDFVTGQLGVSVVHDNYTPGHSASSPMQGMIVHYTAAQTEDGTIKYFAGSDPHASTHFIVGSFRNGLVVQLFHHGNRTWHAGSTYNKDRFGFDFANAGFLSSGPGGWETYSGSAYTTFLPLHGTEPITVTGGIPNAPEDAPGGPAKYASKEHWQPYTYYQLLSFVLVTRALHLVYGLSPDKMQRHGDVAGSRVDPGPALPLTFLLDLVFSSDDALASPWLEAFREAPDWIEDHPEAR